MDNEGGSKAVPQDKTRYLQSHQPGASTSTPELTDEVIRTCALSLTDGANAELLIAVRQRGREQESLSNIPDKNLNYNILEQEGEDERTIAEPPAEISPKRVPGGVRTGESAQVAPQLAKSEGECG